MLDAIGRRMRFGPKQPDPKHKRINTNRENLVSILATLGVHDYAPSSFIFPLTGYENYGSLKRHLLKLTHGTTHTPALLFRPPQQEDSKNAKCQYLVYGLTPDGQRVLREHGLPYIARNEHFIHRLMQSCVTSTIELICRENGLRFINRVEILGDKPLRLPIAGGAVEPDELFGIDYGDSVRYFALEIDRATEPVKRKNIDQTDFHKKLLGYAEALRNRTYKTEWGIPKMVVATVTTNLPRITTIKNAMAEIDEKLAKHFIYNCTPEFATPWEIPEVDTMKRALLTWDSPSASFSIKE